MTRTRLHGVMGLPARKLSPKPPKPPKPIAWDPEATSNIPLAGWHPGDDRPVPALQDEGHERVNQ